MRCLFQHGMDFNIGDKPLGPIERKVNVVTYKTVAEVVTENVPVTTCVPVYTACAPCGH